LYAKGYPAFDSTWFCTLRVPRRSARSRWKRRDSLLQIDGIPEDDRGDNEIEPTGLVLQILPEPVANSAATVEENRPSQ
jgi:hypothetical protein